MLAVAVEIAGHADAHLPLPLGGEPHVAAACVGGLGIYLVIVLRIPEYLRSVVGAIVYFCRRALDDVGEHGLVDDAGRVVQGGTVERDLRLLLFLFFLFLHRAGFVHALPGFLQILFCGIERFVGHHIVPAAGPVDQDQGPDHRGLVDHRAHEIHKGGQGIDHRGGEHAPGRLFNRVDRAEQGVIDAVADLIVQVADLMIHDVRGHELAHLLLGEAAVIGIGFDLPQGGGIGFQHRIEAHEHIERREGFPAELGDAAFRQPVEEHAQRLPAALDPDDHPLCPGQGLKIF